jgi:hypothetical protein
MGDRSVIAFVGDLCLVREVSPTGRLSTHWERREHPMSKIPAHHLDTAIYLYPDSDAAEDGIDSGGSGFLIGVTDGSRSGTQIYAVTNRHVAEKCKTIRLNRIDDVKAVIEPKVWLDHPDGKTDLSIAPLSVEDLRIYRWQIFMPRMHFVDKTRLVDCEIGVGDDCYMVGRFINHDGIQRNLPTARFGAIAQMPGEEIWTEWGIQQEAYLVEMRSISGFSGSPVIVRIPAPRRAKSKRIHEPHLLLGIDCGHSTDKETAIYQHGEIEPVDDYKIEINTGLAIVIPAWKLQEIVDSPTAVKMRDEEKRE